jgi:L-arabinokinase
VQLEIDSSVPIAQGVSSSAALEVATARALGADRLVEPLELARLCQLAENGIVGAPCGIMDQVAVALGRRGSVLPILCRPASVEPVVPLPDGVEVVGWSSGVTHAVAGSAYRTARAASFMGRRIAEQLAGRRWDWTSQVPEDLLAQLPETIEGVEFLDRWGGTDDALSRIEESTTYPVRAATGFGVEEHLRTTRALEALRSGEVAALGPLLAASHEGYRRMGLGHPVTDRIVAEAVDRPGVYGARSSGGGSGGTVVVLCDPGAVDDIEGIIR